jgi:hypothetical protein
MGTAPSLVRDPLLRAAQPEASPLTVHVLDVAQQRNAYDCGPLLIGFVAEIARTQLLLFEPLERIDWSPCCRGRLEFRSHVLRQ